MILFLVSLLDNKLTAKLSAMRDIPVPICFTLLPDGQGLWITKDFRWLPLTGSETAADNARYLVSLSSPCYRLTSTSDVFSLPT